MSKRDRIIEEAAMLFRTYGIRSVTMDMLANQMGISKRTIYEMFQDKDELLQGVLKWMTEKQREVSSRILNESENVIEAIFKMLDLMKDHFQNMSPAFLMDIRKYRHYAFRNMDDKTDIPFIRIHEDIVTNGIKEGIFREDIDVQLINMCLQEVSRMSNDTDLLKPDDLIRKDVIRNVYINYLRGISTQKGLDLINFYEKKQIL